MSASLQADETVRLQLPRKLSFLMEMHPYKVAYGGRSSLKSWSFSRALLTLGLHQDLRILVLREVQKSIRESVHALLKDQIASLKLHNDYKVTDEYIQGRDRDTRFNFVGLSDHTAETIKGYEGFDIFWFNEAQAIRKYSWHIALPTLFRTPGSEAWVDFNPGLDSDEVWQRFVEHPPEGAIVREMNWRDAVSCGWWSPQQEALRQYDLQHAKAEYDNIWEGKPRVTVAGAIFAAEVVEMVTESRFRPLPYDPRFPVHRVWDLGWNDLMTCVMVQKTHPSALNIINYMEDSHITYANFMARLDRLNYRWGDDWLPHDAAQHDPKSGTNARKLFQGMGCTVKDIPKSHPEARIKAARMMWPRIYMDNSKAEVEPERPDRQVGAAFLLDRLKKYKRVIPKTTNEPGDPVHDAASHGADAFGGLAEIVDQIRNDGDRPAVKLPGFRNVDSSMGMLG